MLLSQPPPTIHTLRFHVRRSETMATTSGGDKSPGRQRINSLYGTLAKGSAFTNSRRYSHAPQSLGVPSVGVASDRRSSTQGRHHRGMSMDTAFADISKSVLKGSRKQSTDKSRLGLPLMDASTFGRRRSLRERNRGTSDPTLPASGTEDMGPRKASNKSIKSFSRQLKLQELMKKFRRAARLAIFCRRQTLAHSLRNKEHDELLPFIRDLKFTDYQDFGTALDVDIWDGFNPNDFKANRQLRLSEEAKRILTKPSGERTEQELNYVEISLRNIKAYSDYTVRMQRKIAEVGMYERFEAKRIIVRQSHPPNAFYILLSGSVVVVVMDQETRVAKPVAILKRGRAFGELGLINRTPRQSSCIAKETVEMLSISIQDFRQIFMTGGDDDEELIEKLDCFNGWPVQILESNPKKLMHHFFKKGDVVVKDSNYSNWIVVVKSGHLHVLKKLRKVGAYEWKRTYSVGRPDTTYDPLSGFGFKFPFPDGPVDLSEAEKKKRNKAEMREYRLQKNFLLKYILPELKIPLKPTETEEPTKYRRSSVKISGNLPKQDPTIKDVQLTTESFALPDIGQSDSLVRRHTDMPEKSPPGDANNNDTTRSKSMLETVQTTYDIDPVEEVAHVNTPRGTVSPRDKVSPRYHVSQRDQESPRDPGSPQQPKSKRKSNKSPTKLKVKEDKDEDEKKIQQQVRTINDDLNAEYKKDEEDMTDADRNPAFIHVQTLSRGDVFGLNQFVLGNQPSFCVMSNGAEVMMINKQFYQDNAPEKLIARLRRRLAPYPTDDEMQDNLQISVDWDAYKGEALGRTLADIETKKKMAQTISPR